MRRALLVVLGAALVSCGLVVGSTQNYAGSFCRDLDVATVVCNSFDDPDGGSAGWTTPPTDGSPNAISLTTPEAPVAAPWSRPRLLRIDTGSGAPLDRWRIFIEDSGAPVTCELDGVIDQAASEPTMIAWMEIDNGQAQPVRAVGLMAGSAGLDVGQCKFVFQSGLIACASVGNAVGVSPGQWFHAKLEFGAPLGTSVTLDMGPNNRQPSIMDDAGIEGGAGVGFAVGAVGDDGAAPGLVARIDNVFCHAP